MSSSEPTMPPDLAIAARLTYTIRQTAKLLGVSAPTVYEAARTGALPTIRLGRRVLVPAAALERLLAGDR